MTASAIDQTIDMFDTGGEVETPYRGRMPVADFFTKLRDASRQNKLTVFDVLIGENGNSAAAHFEYDWTLASGDYIIFQGADYFRFSEAGKIASLSIFNHKHPTQQDVGDKYGNA